MCLRCATDAAASCMFSLPFLLAHSDLGPFWFLVSVISPGDKSGETVSSRRLLLCLTDVPYV